MHNKSKDKNVLLYHGSKNGLKGKIKPISRQLCDFGRGFYMGSEQLQPLTLICNYPNAKLYTLRVSLEGLHMLDIEVGIDWALLIAFHRGKLEHIKSKNLYKKYASYSTDFDMVVGDIANDRMFVVLDRFFNGEITDIALISSLSVLKLGKQYVALTNKACDKIDIIDVKSIETPERTALKIQSESYRIEGIRKADEICKKHRRDGRFFDEIIEGGD